MTCNDKAFTSGLCFDGSSFRVTQLLLRNYEGDLDGLTKQQKQAVEKAELSQALDMRNSSKKLHQEQVQLYSALGGGH